MFDFSSYFDVANDLAGNNGEKYIRSGIIRYYYAGFGHARIYLVENMGEVRFLDGKNIHKRICERLINSKDNTEASIGEKLDDLKKIRNDADYDWNLDEEYFRNRLMMVQKDSKEIIEQVNSLKNSPPYKI